MSRDYFRFCPGDEYQKSCPIVKYCIEFEKDYDVFIEQKDIIEKIIKEKLPELNKFTGDNIKVFLSTIEDDKLFEFEEKTREIYHKVYVHENKEGIETDEYSYKINTLVFYNPKTITFNAVYNGGVVSFKCEMYPGGNPETIYISDNPLSELLFVVKFYDSPLKNHFKFKEFIVHHLPIKELVERGYYSKIITYDDKGKTGILRYNEEGMCYMKTFRKGKYFTSYELFDDRIIFDQGTITVDSEGKEVLYKTSFYEMDLPDTIIYYKDSDKYTYLTHRENFVETEVQCVKNGLYYSTTQAFIKIYYSLSEKIHEEKYSSKLYIPEKFKDDNLAFDDYCLQIEYNEDSSVKSKLYANSKGFIFKSVDYTEDTIIEKNFIKS